MIDIEEKYLIEIKRILKNNVPDREVWAFGSRVNGKVEKYSDIDLVIVGDSKISDNKLSYLKEAFATSELPIMIDVLDWQTITDEFKKIILKKYEVIQAG